MREERGQWPPPAPSTTSLCRTAGCVTRQGAGQPAPHGAPAEQREALEESSQAWEARQAKEGTKVALVTADLEATVESLPTMAEAVGEGGATRP